MRKLALSDEILMKIEKPARYIGGEFNAIVKDHNEVDTTFAFVFPDVYEVGMSHLGIQILYDLLNRRDDVCCERVYSPWIDLDKIMREQNIPLFSLETQTPVKNFDFLAITLQYEMCYTNILQVLDLSGIPLLSKDRTEDDPIVIGGGPAGMMAAITAAEYGNNVTIIEKNSDFGKKLLITGKGRCNITSSLYMSEFIKNTPGNGQFLYSAFQNYTNTDIIDFLKNQGLEVKEERGNRIFPVTDKSIDVLNCFKSKINELKIKKLFNTRVQKILVQNGEVLGVRTEKEIIQTDKIILATGGKSYPLTGSTGDGYLIAKNIGHKVTEIRPSLVPLVIYEKNECKEMQGLSLRNVGIKIIDESKNKLIYEDFGEMIFTHFGISGPTILSGSAHLVRYKEIDNLMKEQKIKLQIDLKPALTEEQLDERILRDFKEFKNKQFKHALDKLLPQKMIPIVIEKTKINEEKISISVGRVMTCVLGMIVSREREIRNFVKTKYYKIIGEFGNTDGSFKAEWRVNEK